MTKHISGCVLKPTLGLTVLSNWDPNRWHIILSKLIEAKWHIVNYGIIGSDNGLSPGQCQAIIWSNAGLLIGLSGTNFNEISIKIHPFSFKKINLKKCIYVWRIVDSLRPSDAIWHHRTWSKLVQIMPIQHQAITWNNFDYLSVAPSWINFSKIWQIKISSFKKINFKVLSATWQPCYSDLSVLTPSENIHDDSLQTQESK